MASQTEENEDLDRLLKEKFTNDFRKGYVTVQGVCLPITYKRFEEEIENFEVKDDDVWVCSFPKSGTTWTQEMIWCIGNNVDLEEAKKTLLIDRFPFLELTVLFDYENVTKLHPDRKLTLRTSNSVAYTRNMPSPRFIKCHLPFHLLPRQIRTGEKKPKIVYVTRNPKDTCVSYYYHSRLMEDYRGNFDEFCRLFLGHKLNYTPYWDHVVGFWTRRNAMSNILCIKYEDMKADLAAVIRKAAAFLNKPVPEDKMEMLVKHLSFDSMKTNWSVNYEEQIAGMQKLNTITADGKFIRKGQVNQWKEEMPPSVIKKFDEMTKEKYAPHNLSF
ncbi:sulfotransferase 1 family member D1-like [Ceratina calcarata]|uniref:Sulfotransferase 1 family member D1-like n=1 Tax=Ceratina calcarata TaxID=156304 RepID=A0AAJ7WF70_9HYME|nr:sulfotransferase 1 family member D1-like [Ceratina calcarata]